LPQFKLSRISYSFRMVRVEFELSCIAGLNVENPVFQRRSRLYIVNWT